MICSTVCILTCKKHKLGWKKYLLYKSNQFVDLVSQTQSKCLDPFSNHGLNWRRSNIRKIFFVSILATWCTMILGLKHTEIKVFSQFTKLQKYVPVTESNHNCQNNTCIWSVFHGYQILFYCKEFYAWYFNLNQLYK